MMIGFNCDVVVGVAVEVVGVAVVVVGAAVVVVGGAVVVVGAAVVVVGGAVVAWSACGLGSATSLELLPHDAMSRLIARTHGPQSLRPAHLMSDSSPRPTKRYRLWTLKTVRRCHSGRWGGEQSLCRRLLRRDLRLLGFSILALWVRPLGQVTLCKPPQ